jgi:uncharacterized Zn-binding protein involved in type VI secretion
MRPTARLMDMTIGDKGPGIVIPLHSTVLVNNMPIGKIMDIALAFSGAVGLIIEGSPTVLANGLPVARMGDKFVGSYNGIIIQGSPTVLCK